MWSYSCSSAICLIIPLITVYKKYKTKANYSIHSLKKDQIEDQLNPENIDSKDEKSEKDENMRVNNADQKDANSL